MDLSKYRNFKDEYKKQIDPRKLNQQYDIMFKKYNDVNIIKEDLEKYRPYVNNVFSTYSYFTEVFRNNYVPVDGRMYFTKSNIAFILSKLPYKDNDLNGLLYFMSSVYSSYQSSPQFQVFENTVGSKNITNIHIVAFLNYITVSKLLNYYYDYLRQQQQFMNHLTADRVPTMARPEYVSSKSSKELGRIF